jgi:hypothetical protein
MENSKQDTCEHWNIQRVSDRIFNLNQQQTPNDYWICGKCGMKFFDIIDQLSAGAIN